MADLQGPKIRVGKFDGGKVELVQDAVFTLDASLEGPGDTSHGGLDYKELPRDVHPGDVLLLNDGLIELVVERVEGPRIVTTVKIGGELSNNKGINRQGGGLTAPALTREGHGGHQDRHVAGRGLSSRYRFRRMPPIWKWPASSRISRRRAVWHQGAESVPDR